MKGRVRVAIGTQRPVRPAVEVRHESFNEPSFIELLREQRIALMIGETSGQWRDADPACPPRCAATAQPIP